MLKIFKVFSLVLLLLFYACNDESKHIDKKKTKGKLFTILSSQETGVIFQNLLKENTHMNGLFYEYFYNGGGVAVGDLNGDHLTDIYFINNLKPNSLYLNQGGIKFKDVTIEANAKGKGFSTGVTMVDINSDGKLDIYISNSGKFNDPNKRRNQLLINTGNNQEGVPVFENQAAKYGLDLPHYSTQAAFFDYDLDNDLDMFLINHGVEVYDDAHIAELINKESEGRGEKLYRNDNGFFVDVTKESGIISNLIGFGLGLSIGDLNNDGLPDVYVSNDFSEKDHLYFNNGDGTFTENSIKALNHISNFSMGNDIADINNDGWMDIMAVDMVSEDNYGIKTSMSGMNPKRFNKHVDLGLHHQYMFNTLQLNNGIIDTISKIPSFSEIAHIAGLSNTDWSWSPLFFDMNNSGQNDIFISNGIKRDFRNSDFQKFQKKKREQALEDRKNGKPFNLNTFISELLEKMPPRKKQNYFFQNNGDLTFSKANQKWADSLLTSSNGAAYVDFDNDGDLDIVVNNSDDRSFIYRNNAMENELGNYLKIKLNGPHGNIDGIGCRITIYTNNERQVKEQFLTRGFQSSVDRIMHFGLGQNKKISKLEISWPDGKRQKIDNIEANQLLQLDYKNAENNSKQLITTQQLFKDITSNVGLTHRHIENFFDDFKRESLLPHKMSEHGPALAVSDVNGDGLDDFYIGGSLGFSGTLFLQTSSGTFEKSTNPLWVKEKAYEDISAVFFDADQDGDNDLYITSGGNEREIESKFYQDRLYLNDGKGNFIKAIGALPKMITSSSSVKLADFDNDGDMDIFVGGRQVPGKYPFPTNSYLLRNDSKPNAPLFTDITSSKAPMLKNIGMVTDAIWIDIDNNGLLDLMIVGEWMPIKVLKNTGEKFVDYTDQVGLKNQTGWWYSINASDFDNDGDLDLIVGNLGLNYKYKASKKEPFEVFSRDFDNNGSFDIVLSYHNDGNLFPLRGRECSSQQMPFIKDKFPTYNAFGKANILEIFGKNNLEMALHYSANTFATTYFENLDGTFVPHILPTLAQLSSTNTILVDDYNYDGNMDILIAGNLYGAEVETPRNDASFGMLLFGDGTGEFTAQMSTKSGLQIQGEVKHVKTINLSGSQKAILFARNNLPLNLFAITSVSNSESNIE